VFKVDADCAPVSDDVVQQEPRQLARLKVVGDVASDQFPQLLESPAIGSPFAFKQVEHSARDEGIVVILATDRRFQAGCVKRSVEDPATRRHPYVVFLQTPAVTILTFFAAPMSSAVVRTKRSRSDSVVASRRATLPFTPTTSSG